MLQSVQGTNIISYLYHGEHTAGQGPACHVSTIVIRVGNS